MKKLNLLLIWLFSLIWLSSFCSAWSYIFTWHFSANNGPSYWQGWWYFPLPNSDYNGFLDINYDCYITNLNYDTDNNSSLPNFQLTFSYMKRTSSAYSYNAITSTWMNNHLVWNVGSLLNNNDKNSFLWYNNVTLWKSNWTITNAYSLDYYCEFTWSDNYSCDYSWYILESDINTWYCVDNNLCPVASCDYSEYESQINSLSWSLNSCQNSLWASSISLASCQNSLNSCLSANCPSVWVSRSSLFINDIQHLWASNIYMTIPEEFDRDYSYSNSWESMEIDIEWYNVDYDKINWLVSLQSYKPTSEDFTKLVSNLWGYFKILVFLLFAYILIKWIKNIFKSKKL